MKYKEAEVLLQTYDFEELLEINETTTEEVLCFLVNQKFLELPEVLPVDASV